MTSIQKRVAALETARPSVPTHEESLDALGRMEAHGEADYPGRSDDVAALERGNRAAVAAGLE